MHITELRVRNFRNFLKAKFRFEPRVNTIIGENGSGKTNVFHAIRLLLDESLERNAVYLSLSLMSKELRDPYIRQQESLPWLRACVEQLLGRRDMDLALLVRAKFILVRKLEAKRNECRLAAYDAGYQELLFGPSAAPETSFEYAFKYDPYVYPARSWYSGTYSFAKHFYGRPGELESKGEEFDCAFALDGQSGVRHWVRNLALQPDASFWLQTRTDRFYPDFVAELLDGRLLVVEYKGRDYITNDDSKEKMALGEVWEKSSNGRALFLMAVKKDERGLSVHEQIRAKIEGW